MRWILSHDLRFVRFVPLVVSKNNYHKSNSYVGSYEELERRTSDNSDQFALEDALSEASLKGKWGNSRSQLAVISIGEGHFQSGGLKEVMGSQQNSRGGVIFFCYGPCYGRRPGHSSTV